MLSEAISKYTVNLKYEDLPEDVVAMAKIAIMDWLGSVHYSTAAESSRGR